MTFTGGSANSIIINGDAMWDRSTSHYHVTIMTTYFDIYGNELFHKRDINFIVIQILFP